MLDEFQRRRRRIVVDNEDLFGAWLFAHRDLVGGLKFIEEPPVLRFFFGRLTALNNWGAKLAEAPILKAKEKDAEPTLNLAERITCPVLVSCGLRDPICPPKNVYAAYNRLPVPKKIFNNITAGHAYSPEAARLQKAAVFDYLKSVQ